MAVAGQPSPSRFERMPRPGEPAPWFHALIPDNPNFSFDTAVGRRVVLCFFGDLPEAGLRELMQQVRVGQARFDAAGCVFFGVGNGDEAQTHAFKKMLPGRYLFLDRDRAVRRRYGLVPIEGTQTSCRGTSFVLDERLRVTDVAPLADGDAERHVGRLLRALEALPVQLPERVATLPAPVLVVPRVFEPELCRALIGCYEREGGEPSGFMCDVVGRTVLVHDPKHKRRRDRALEDAWLRDACMHRIHDRLMPEIEKAFQFRATRIERYIVACYEAEDAGHFRAHRDNTTLGTAHRRFAVSLNLNTGDFEGGLLGFPEFGRQLYQVPAGGAVVFSCSLLHRVTPVTAGRRYVFLPFLYDEAAVKVRNGNRRYL